jgi:hypothetical protein
MVILLQIAPDENGRALQVRPSWRAAVNPLLIRAPRSRDARNAA